MKKISLLVIFMLLLTMLVGLPILAYQEAPMLKEKVDKGELPSVDERLPKEPLVLPARNNIGEYGGTLNTAGTRVPPMDGYSIGNFVGQTLVTYAWGLRGEQGEIVPNIAGDFKTNDESTEFTFYLRKGLKWSDGQPYTTEDLKFYWENVLNNKELTSTIPDTFKNADGTIMDFKVLDKYTVKLISTNPKPFFLYSMASAWFGGQFCMHPKHYMKKFHPEFTEEAELNKLMEEEGFEEWFQLYGAKAGSHKPTSNPDKPRLQAWIPKRVPPATPPWTWERNPYFWAVDEEGNQLPYIDALQNTKVDQEVKNMRALAGELDIGWALSFEMYPEYKKKEKDGSNYRVGLWFLPFGCDRRLHFNMTSEDKVLREIFNDLRFRKAVSYAINRQEINNLLRYGMTEPQQELPPKGTKLYEETKDYGKLYTEYKPDKARNLLDEMGLDEKGSSGYRLRPDGEELFLNLNTYEKQWTPTIELVAQYLREIGINAKLKLVEGSLFWEKVRNNQYDSPMIAGGPINPTLIGSEEFAPISASAMYAPQYGLWYSSNGEEGEKPTGDFMKNLEMYDELLLEADEEKRLEMQKEMVKTARENLWSIGTLEIAPLVITINKNLKNLPQGKFPMCWDNIFADIARPETYYFDNK